MRRFLRVLATLSIATTCLVSLQTPAQAGPSAKGHVDVHEILAGTTETFEFTVTNTSTETSIGWVEIDPSTTDLTVTDAAAEGFSASIDPSSGKTKAIFTGGPIAIGETRSFFLLVDAAPRDNNDSGSSWSLHIRETPTASSNGVSNDQNEAFKTNVRVLSIDYLDVTDPEGALDYTVTQGQQITLDSTISNYGTQQVNSVDPKLVVASNDSFTVTPTSPEIPAGSSVAYSFTYTAGDPGTRVLEALESKTCCSAIRAFSEEITIQPSPVFTYASGSLAPAASVSQASQAFSLSVAKNDSPAVYLDPALTKLSFRDNGADVFSTTLAEATTIDEGATEAALTFASLTIPNVSNKAYGVRLTLAGEDDNGKVFNQVIDTTASFVKEDGMPYAKPQVAAPQGQVDPDGMPVVKDGDTITLSGDIKTSGAPNAPIDPTAQILDCDLAVLDAGLTRVGSIDVPLTQCQNAGGHFAGQIAPANIGVTEGYLRLEAQVRKAVGGVASPPDQVSSLTGVDNVAPTIFNVASGCGLHRQNCDELRHVRVHLSEPVRGVLLPAVFAVTQNTVLKIEEQACVSATARCALLGLTTGLPYEAGKRQLAYSPLAEATELRDAAGNPLGEFVLKVLDCHPTLVNVSTSGEIIPHCTPGEPPSDSQDLQGCVPPSENGTVWEVCPDDTRVERRNPCKRTPGKSGHRLRVFYAFPSGSRAQTSDAVKAIRSKLRYADAYLDESNAARDQHFRFQCTSFMRGGRQSYRIRVTSVPLVIEDLDENSDNLTFDELKLAMQRAGYDAEAVDDMANGEGRVFVTFLSHVSGEGNDPNYLPCGEGELASGENPDIPAHADRGGLYAFVKCWGGDTILHEVFHTLGAVQPGAPHSTYCRSLVEGRCGSGTGGHCWDESADNQTFDPDGDADALCYDDSLGTPSGTVLDNRGLPVMMENLCVDDMGAGDSQPAFWQLDCAHQLDDELHQHDGGEMQAGEDYWDPESASRWLLDHWNTADSVFLTDKTRIDRDEPMWWTDGF